MPVIKVDEPVKPPLHVFNLHLATYLLWHRQLHVGLPANLAWPDCFFSGTALYRLEIISACFEKVWQVWSFILMSLALIFRSKMESCALCFRPFQVREILYGRSWLVPGPPKLEFWTVSQFLPHGQVCLSDLVWSWVKRNACLCATLAAELSLSVVTRKSYRRL